MAKRQSTLQRSKRTENAVQRFLWPGTSRAWKDDHDVRGDDRDGWPIWGEVKNYSSATINESGGPYAVLKAAYRQCEQAIERHPEEWPEVLHTGWALAGYTCVQEMKQVRPRPFAVLWLKSCRRDCGKLVMYLLPCCSEPVVMTLAQFKAWVIDGAQEAVA